MKDDDTYPVSVSSYSIASLLRQVERQREEINSLERQITEMEQKEKWIGKTTVFILGVSLFFIFLPQIPMDKPWLFPIIILLSIPGGFLAGLIVSTIVDITYDGRIIGTRSKKANQIILVVAYATIIALAKHFFIQ